MGGFVVTPFTFAETFDPAIDGLIRNQQRQAELEKIIQPERDVNLEVVQKKEAVKLTDIEDQNCFETSNLYLPLPYRIFVKDTLMSAKLIK